MMKINDFFNSNNNYVIAEIAQNHDGSLGQAHSFIDAVAETGADAIKFQTHIAAEESTKHEPFRVNFSYCDRTRYDYWHRMEFTEEQWTGLYQHANEKGLEFLSSPFSLAALEMLDRIGIPAWKLGSGEVFNDILLEKAISTGKPIILSTGLSTYFDIDKQIEMVKKRNGKAILMQCTTAYPSSPEIISLKLITEFAERYGCPVGISDHSATIYPSLAAATLGARVFEVHVTMSRYMFGPDIKASVTIEELKTIVDGVKNIKTMLNTYEDKNKLSSGAQELKRMFSKGLYAKCNMKAGDTLTVEKIIAKKPNNGINTSEILNIIGRKLKKDIMEDDTIEWENIEE